MPAHRKVALKAIKTLTFHANQVTNSRRTKPIRELTCIGTPCKVFQPDVVQCTNMGDDGTGNVQWRCDTDLPNGLRLGKVEVSCEGWSRAGDSNVLQGSCGLEYNLHRTDKGLAYGDNPLLPSKFDTWLDKAFSLIFWVVLLTLLYSILRSLLLRFFPRWAPPSPTSFFPWSGHDGHHHGGGGGGGGGPPRPGFNPGPPPPYTKDETFPQSPSPSYTSQAQQGTGAGGSGPGFWTGILAGGAAGYFAANRNNPGNGGLRDRGRYERPGRFAFGSEDEPRRGSSSNLGEMRRATGFGGSSTR